MVTQVYKDLQHCLIMHKTSSLAVAAEDVVRILCSTLNEFI